MGECPVCLGEGSVPSVPTPMDCPNCGGSGEDETVGDTPMVPSELSNEANPVTAFAWKLATIISDWTRRKVREQDIVDAVGDASIAEVDTIHYSGKENLTVEVLLGYKHRSLKEALLRLQPDYAALSEALGSRVVVAETEMDVDPNEGVNRHVSIDALSGRTLATGGDGGGGASSSLSASSGAGGRRHHLKRGRR